MVKFKDDPALGQVVKKVTAWSFGYEPVKDMWALRFAAGGNKFSQLCAFKFESAAPEVEHPKFSIAFVAKLRSKIYHLSRNSSQWYIFKHISPTRIDVLSKEQLLVNYGFDIDKFFQSDIFNGMIARFKGYIENGLNVEIPKFKKTLKSVADEREAGRFAQSIAEGLKIMTSTTSVNDKYYKLLVNPDLEESSSIDEKIEDELEKAGAYVDLNDCGPLEAEESKEDEDPSKAEEEKDYVTTCNEFAKQIVPILMNDKQLKQLADSDGNMDNALAWVVCSLAEHLKSDAGDADIKKLGDVISKACKDVML